MKKALRNLLLYLFLPSLLPLLFETNVDSKNYIILMFITYILLTIFFVTIYKEDVIKSIKKFELKELFKLSFIFIIGLLFMILSNYIINYLIIPNNISNNERTIRELLNNYRSIYTILLSLIIPFLEEVTFRIEFKNIINNKYIYLIVTSLIFSILHVLGSTKIIEILYLVPYFILGYTLSYIYLKENNIIYNTFFHSLNNVLTIIVLML